MKVLISGFDPFGKDEINPSMEAIKCLPDQIDEYCIIKVTLPTVAYACEKVMLEMIKKHHPDFVINVGQAAGRSGITVERIAINVNDFSIPDNEGQQFFDVPIKNDGMDGYFSNLPIKAIVQVLRDEGFSASVSNSAGTFVCNHIMYCMQYARHTVYPDMKCGFVHIPCLPEQTLDNDLHSMELNDIVSALICLIKHLSDEELSLNEGKIC